MLASMAYDNVLLVAYGVEREYSVWRGRHLGKECMPAWLKRNWTALLEAKGLFLMCIELFESLQLY